MNWHKEKNTTQTENSMCGSRVAQHIVPFKPVFRSVPLFYSSLMTAVLELLWRKIKVRLGLMFPDELRNSFKE